MIVILFPQIQNEFNRKIIGEDKPHDLDRKIVFGGLDGRIVS